MVVIPAKENCWMSPTHSTYTSLDWQFMYFINQLLLFIEHNGWLTHCGQGCVSEPGDLVTCPLPSYYITQFWFIVHRTSINKIQLNLNPKTHITGDPLHSWAACTQPCNVNTHSRVHCSPGARLCEQWGHGCVNHGARLCASARLCRGRPVTHVLKEIPLTMSSAK